MSIAIQTFSSSAAFVVVGQSFDKIVVKALIELAKKLFNVLQWAFVSLYGAKEILFDRVRDISRSKRNFIITHSDRINNYLNKVFVKKESFLGPVKHNVMHGSLYMTSGLAGSIAAMHKHGWIKNVGDLALPLEAAGQGFFSLASLVALIQNVRICRVASKVPAYAPLYAHEAASRLKISAVCGIISSLNYIFTAAAMILGASAAFALIFGCIAVFTGCLKIVYDFFRFKGAR